MTRLAGRCPGAEIVGLDIDPAMIALARGRVEADGLGTRVWLVEGDVAAMPFAEASFDLVVNSFSAHHWPDGPAAFREIGRVLRPGAVALVYDLPDILTPFFSAAFIRLCGHEKRRRRVDQ